MNLKLKLTNGNNWIDTTSLQDTPQALLLNKRFCKECDIYKKVDHLTFDFERLSLSDSTGVKFLNFFQVDTSSLAPAPTMGGNPFQKLKQIVRFCRECDDHKQMEELIQKFSEWSLHDTQIQQVLEYLTNLCG